MQRKNSKSVYVIDETGTTRENLEKYLHRSVTMAEFLTVDLFCNDATYPNKERDVKLMENIEAKFIGRSIYRWGDEGDFNKPDFLHNAKITEVNNKSFINNLRIDMFIFLNCVSFKY